MKYFIGFIILTTTVLQSNAQDTLKYCTNDGIGLGGYDAVSYFKQETPSKGNPEIFSIVHDVKYLFASKNNKSLFDKDPESYLPAYGGWCSMTLVMGVATQPVYENFLIKDDKLYLFERTLSVDGKLLWLQDHEKNKVIAEDHYTQYRTTGQIK